MPARARTARQRCRGGSTSSDCPLQDSTSSGDGEATRRRCICTRGPAHQHQRAFPCLYRFVTLCNGVHRPLGPVVGDAADAVLMHIRDDFQHFERHFSVDLVPLHARSPPGLTDLDFANNKLKHKSDKLEELSGAADSAVRYCRCSPGCGGAPTWFCTSAVDAQPPVVLGHLGFCAPWEPWPASSAPVTVAAEAALPQSPCRCKGPCAWRNQHCSTMAGEDDG